MADLTVELDRILLSRRATLGLAAMAAVAGALPARAQDLLQKNSEFYSGTIIASDPSLQRTKTGIMMAYTDLDWKADRTVIAVATSTDNGQTWNTKGKIGVVNGAVIAGRTGKWDENVESPALVSNGTGWLLYFSGYRDKGNPFKGFPAALWLASSQDGVKFTRVQDGPIMQPTKGWYDNDAIYSPTVLKDGNLFHMIYVGHSYTDFSKIGNGGVYLLHASSPDGVNWTKSPDPVTRPGQLSGWQSEGVAEPYLVKRGPNDYLLFYTGLSGEERAIGVATGPSVLGPWTFGKKPIIRPGAPGTPDEHQVLAPAALLDANDGTVRLWFLAADSKGMLRIGRATGSVSKMIAATR